MANTINYGLKALIAGCRICALPDCHCKPDLKLMRTNANKKLDSSHQLSKATFKAICADLDLRRISDRPSINASDEKQRDDGNFERAVEEAFKVRPSYKQYLFPSPAHASIYQRLSLGNYSDAFLIQAFRDQEREIVLNAPAGFQEAFSCSDDSTGKWWLGAAHLRHHVEFLLVLKGLKPCLLFHKYNVENCPLFSTVILDCLVPIMDRLGLWSYGFGISIQTGNWVFYDARSPLMPLVDKIFLTHDTIKDSDPTAYPDVTDHRQVAVALGYPVPSDKFPSDRWIYILDKTESDVLVSKGWPEPRCCVQAMVFGCPVGGEDDLRKVFVHFAKCEQAARSVGTHLNLGTDHHPEMKAWLGRLGNFREILGLVEDLEPELGLEDQDEKESLDGSESELGGMLEIMKKMQDMLKDLSLMYDLDQADEDAEDSDGHV